MEEIKPGVEEIEIEVVCDGFLENEGEQVAALHRTFSRLLTYKRWDLFNNVVIKCIDRAPQEKISGLLAVALWANKIKNKVPLYNFLIGAIKNELEVRNYSKTKVENVLRGLYDA